MVKQASLSTDLESLLGADAVLPADRAPEFAVDGVIPGTVVAPATVEQVAQVLRFANGHGLAVIPWGRGTHMHIGNVPRRYDIALSLARLDRVVEHEPADLTVTCQAGITLTDLQRRLAAAGQLVPLSVRSGEATVGGVLAANASGPARHAYGAARDFTIGLRVVTADGRITRAGGRVVKNVAGYDLCKLYVGSLGTLGVIVEATFKVMPLPKAQRSMALGFDSAADACALAAEVERRGLSLRALELLNPAASAAAGLPRERWGLLADLAGTPAAADRSAREIAELTRHSAVPYAAQLPQGARPVLAAGQLLCKASLLPSKLPALAGALEAVDPPPAVVAWPTVGIVYASWRQTPAPEALVSRSREAVSRLGGTLVVVICPSELKRDIDVFGDLPPSFELMRRLKDQLDPKGILSPGRFLGRL